MPTEPVNNNNTDEDSQAGPDAPPRNQRQWENNPGSLNDKSMCLGPLEVINGAWPSPSGGYKTGMSATLTCGPGFTAVPASNATITCSAGLWEFSGNYPDCLPDSSEAVIVQNELGEDMSKWDLEGTLDSRCRQSTHLISFYLAELNGLSLIIRIILLGVCFNKYLNKKLRNSYVIALLVIVALHVLVHLIIIIASLPPLCDSANFNWIPGEYFNFKRCHFKSEVYYSDYFWFLDSVLPNILLVIIIYYMKGL